MTLMKVLRSKQPVEKQKIVSQDEETILHCDNRKHIAMGL
jgi:hypothetical protein